MSVAKFTTFLKERAPDVVSFSAEELFVKGGSDANLHLNTDPPEELWPNILPTIRVLQRLRDRLGKVIILHSVYRSPAYNRAIGGAGASAHMEFRACDFHVVDENSGPADWAVTLRAMRGTTQFEHGGVGAYATFVHVDTGATRNFDQIDASKGRLLLTPVTPRPQPPTTAAPAPVIPPELATNQGCWFFNFGRKR